MKDLPWSLRTTMAPLGRKHRGDAKQIHDAGGIQALHICPATGNAPTRMTRASWEVLCAATQRRSRERECIDKNQAQLMRMSRRLNVCSWCQGKTLPRGLEFIDAAEMAEMIKPKEEAMAKQSKLGICENCGDKGALTGSFGKRVCATCLKIRSGVNSHVEKVATAARQLGKAEELLTALVPEGGGLAIKVTADLLQEISSVVGYRGEDPGELVEAVRKVAAGGAQQLASEAESGALRTIARIVGYDGTKGEEVVATVRKRVLTCSSCEAEDVLAEIREIIGYSPDMVDSGLADAVREFADRRPADVPDCANCDVANALLVIAELVGKPGSGPDSVTAAVRALMNQPWPPSGSDQHRVDLLRACGLELDDAVSASSRKDWSWAAAAAVQTIGELTDRRDHLLSLLTKERDEGARLRRDTATLREDFERALQEIETVSAKLTLAEQSRDERESRAVQAEANVQDQAAELNADDSDLREQLKVARELNDRLRSSAVLSRLIWYREALAVLRARLGLDHLDEDEDVVERMLEEIASVGQALTRFQDLATAADRRADEMEANLMEARSEINGLRDAVHGGASGQSALLDIALTALRGDALRGEAVAGLIEAARRAEA